MNDSIEFDWSIGKEDAVPAAGFAFVRTLRQTLYEFMPDLVDLFPFKGQWELRSHLDEHWIALQLIDRLSGTGVPFINKIEPDKLAELRVKIAPFEVRDHKQLVKILGATWYGFESFTYVGPYRPPLACWQHACQHLEEWLNSTVLPEILSRNQNRVLRAIPPSPAFDLDKINRSLWILECEKSMQQGTAFSLLNNQLVTCEHVLGLETHAFRPDQPLQKYPVEIISSNKTLDLAVLNIGIPLNSSLDMGTADNLKQMDHVAIAGFPNYRYGDSGIVMPGLVVGFRMISGIRRILTNAPIIAGTSGGPVLDKSNRVIGVAVTGADLMEKAQDTENHGIIPIDAVKFL